MQHVSDLCRFTLCSGVVQDLVDLIHYCYISGQWQPFNGNTSDPAESTIVWSADSPSQARGESSAVPTIVAIPGGPSVPPMNHRTGSDYWGYDYSGRSDQIFHFD